MALRAGYYGVKKNVVSAIAGLSGAKIIKTIGDGLKLTNAGKLSCDIDTDTMEFKAGKLSAKNSGGVKYKLYQGQGGTETVITLDETPNSIIAVYELGSHGGGYWGFLSAFGSNDCKGLWITPSNNGINGKNLSYSISGNALTISGGEDPTQRAGANGSNYVVLYV